MSELEIDTDLQREVSGEDQAPIEDREKDRPLPGEIARDLGSDATDRGGDGILVVEQLRLARACLRLGRRLTGTTPIEGGALA